MGWYAYNTSSNFGAMSNYQSWGRYPKAKEQTVYHVFGRDDELNCEGNKSLLPRGLGRSQGDSCLNDGGVLMETSRLDHFISFDDKQGVFRCEAGVTLDEILKFIVPRGWFLPVTPGTKFVTAGGALANDVHGKNHHRAGSFGCHVTQFELVRSGGERLVCSPEQNQEWFRATVGGLGLTGLITWVEMRLIPIESSYIEEEVIRMDGLEDFFGLATESDKEFEYTVAWLDCLSFGKALGRGLFMRGKHALNGSKKLGLATHRKPRVSVPIYVPGWLVNKGSVRAFNEVYYRKQLQRRSEKTIHYDSFFYPLDVVADWNKIYGKRGFFQYQCVVPRECSHEVVPKLLEAIAASGMASFLATMKFFGDASSPGIMSFPRPGVTLAIDFVNYGSSTLGLFQKLDDIVMCAQGAVYPAKDARMSARVFKSSFPQWKEFIDYIDPKFSSSFWRRVTS